MEQTAFHAGAVIGFKTGKGEVVHARVASSFISFGQAEANLRELGTATFVRTISYILFLPLPFVAFPA